MVPAMARLCIKYQCTFWVAIKWSLTLKSFTSYTACSKAWKREKKVSDPAVVSAFLHNNHLGSVKAFQVCTVS